MSYLGTILMQRRRDAQMAKSLPALQQIVGQPASAPPQMDMGDGTMGNIDLGRNTQATGAQALPVDQQLEFIGRSMMAVPGFAEQGMATMNAAIQDRVEAGRKESEFARTLFQDQQQFNEQESQDRSQWEQKYALEKSAAGEKTALYLNKVLADARKVELDKLTLQQKEAEIAKNAMMLSAVPTPGQKSLFALTKFASEYDQQLATFKPEYAIDSTFITEGLINIDLLRTTAKTAADRDKVAWWANEAALQNAIFKLEAGGNVTGGEEERQLRVLINPGMKPETMQSELRSRIKRNDRQLDSWIEVYGPSFTNSDRFAPPARNFPTNEAPSKQGPQPGPNAVITRVND